GHTDPPAQPGSLCRRKAVSRAALASPALVYRCLRMVEQDQRQFCRTLYLRPEAGRSLPPEPAPLRHHPWQPEFLLWPAEPAETGAARGGDGSSSDYPRSGAGTGLGKRSRSSLADKTLVQLSADAEKGGPAPAPYPYRLRAIAPRYHCRLRPTRGADSGDSQWD